MIEAKLGGDVVRIHSGEAIHPPTELLGLDVESTYMENKGRAHWAPDFRVRLVQFGTESEAWVYNLANRAERTMAEACFLDDRVSFVSHTNMDVLSVWREFGIDISGRNIDTRMLATQADPNRNETRELKDLATAYGMPELAEGEAELHAVFMEMWVAAKEVTGGRRNAKKADVHAYGWANISADHPVYAKYAGLDAIAARRLAPLLVPATQDPPELLAVDQWLHVRANRIQIRGLRLDKDAAEELHEEAAGAFTRAKKAAEEIAGCNVNGPKVLDYFASEGADWSVWPGALTDGGAPSLAKENLKLLGTYDLADDPAEVLRLMLEQQRHADVKSKTTDILRRAVQHGPDNWRIHPLLNPIGAQTTARMSSAGPNVQNFSKRDPRMRGLFLPDSGHVLATIDFAQIELRTVAALAREQSMIDTILAGGDLHQLTVDALAAMGVTITRDQAKTVNFLIVYGGGAKALHDQTRIPLDAATQIIDAWRQAYPAITALAKWLAYEKDAIRTISNRRLPVTRDKFGSIRSYANINYAVQSAARELLVDAWRRFELTYGRTGIVWWPIHDELVLQVPEGDVEPILADAKKAMTLEFRGVPIEADAIVLRDREGVSRWMTGKLAEKIAEERQAA